jgi:hypothetical protein
MTRLPLILGVVAIIVAAAPASAGAGAPKLSSAASLDRDRDGRVDAVRVTFSSKVRGRGRFSVAGASVDGAGRARGRAVMLRLVEGNGCDLGLLPRVRYRSGLRDARGRRVGASAVDMGRRSGLPPRLTCAVTADGDGDGRLDSLSLTWSRRVRGGTPGAFSVRGYSVRGVSRASGRALSLSLEERSGSDTGATPPVTYARVKKGGVRGRGGQALPGAYNATRDGAGPVLATARTGDGDTDGRVDSIFVGFSEPVRSVPGGLSVEGAVVTGTTPSGDQLTLALAEGPFGTDARPAVSYGGGEVIDAAGNAAPASRVVADDGAGPTITGARTGDRSGDGRLDAVVVTFSEQVSHPGDADGAYPLEVSGYELAGLAGANGATVELALRQGGSPDTGNKPSVRYTRASGAPVLDSAGNEAVVGTLGTTLDGAAPVLVGATTLDVDEDGSLDRLRYRFSEAVSHSLGPGAFSAVGVTALGPLPAVRDAVDVNVTEQPGSNTALLPLVGYEPAGAGSVADPAANLAPAAAGLPAVDGAGPVVVDASTGDNDSDHRLDRVHVTMSEPVTYPGDAGAPFALGTQGYTVASVSAAAGSSFTISLVEPSAPDTGGAPAVSYGGGRSLRDLAGVEAPARSYPGTRDTVAPAFVAAETADVDGDGMLDRVDLRYSEDVQGGSGAAPFAVTGHTVDGIEFSGDRARIVIQEGASPDTDERPSASYVPPGDPAERVKDVAEGNGDTTDDAPAQSLVQADDKAGPAIVQAVTGDASGVPNGRIDRLEVSFSEPVIHSAEASAPFSISLGGSYDVQSVSAASGDAITVGAVEQSQPDGGMKPDVTVSEPELVLDAAGNQAAGGAFSATEDGVRPVLVSARFGEVDAGASCEADSQNGRIDCLRVTWSEPVTHAANPSLTVTPFTPVGTTPAQTGQPRTDVPLVEGSTPDRETTGTVAYSEGAPVPVQDAVGLEALSTTPSVTAAAACEEDEFEENDSRLIDNPLAEEAFSGFICARAELEEDWFRSAPDALGEFHLLINPENGRILRLEVWSETGSAPLASVTADPAGAPMQVHLPGPLPDPYYWFRILGVDAATGDPDPAEEGGYCLDSHYVIGDTCAFVPGEG